MTNKPAYMRKIIIGSSLLFSILLAVPQAHAQESVDVIIHDNGTERREVIDLPKSMTYPRRQSAQRLESQKLYRFGKGLQHLYRKS